MLPQDPAILLSLINMKLRNRYASLADLCEDLDADEDEIRRTLGAAGYTYDPASNAFRPRES